MPFRAASSTNFSCALYIEVFLLSSASEMSSSCKLLVYQTLAQMSATHVIIVACGDRCVIYGAALSARAAIDVCVELTGSSEALPIAWRSVAIALAILLYLRLALALKIGDMRFDLCSRYLVKIRKRKCVLQTHQQQLSSSCPPYSQLWYTATFCALHFRLSNCAAYRRR